MRVGDYELRELLASSEVGSRYQAVDVRNDADIEIFLLRYDAEESSSRRSNCKRLKMAALIELPAARRIVELECDDDTPFLALEWLDGPTLASRPIGLQPLTSEQSLDLIHGLSRAVTEAHRIGLVHGLISPTVIQQRASGEWIIDFSAAVVPARDQAMDQGRAFRAPEFLRDELEPASDVYSLARIAQWLLLGETLFQATRNVSKTELAKQLAAIVALRSVSDALAMLLTQCFAADTSDRPDMAIFTASVTSMIAQVSQPGFSKTDPALDKTSVLNADSAPDSAFSKTIDSDVDIQGSTELALPAELGRFRLVEKLGEGGMGAVYRGEDRADGNQVAVKVLGAGAINHPQSRQRFAKEARLLARITSPYVAKLFEFDDARGSGFLVTEFVPGSNLAILLERLGTLTEASALDVMSDICRGLAAAHGLGIVHRDVKPDNILLTEQGMGRLTGEQTTPTTLPLAKLSDFGLASTQDQTESMAITRQGAVMGTPYYMSPEQCRGQPTDARSDVYAMGATLFHLLAGRPPYVAETHVGILHQHCNDPIPSLTDLKPEIGSGLESVVRKSLAKNPEARYADADALLVDLESLRHGQATSLVLHPQLPEHDSARTVAYTFSWALTSSPAQLWPFISNTDRLNQAIGLPPARYSIRNDPVRGVRRFAETRIAGQALAWEEHPYEWIEGRRMSILREFSRGPFAWFVSVVELVPQSAGGTKLVHKVMLHPRGVLGRVIANFEIGVKANRALRRAYQQVDGFIASGKQRDPTADPFRKSTTLSTRRRNRLQQRIDRVRDPEIEPAVIDTLGQFLEHASDQEVSRIRPKAFAARFGLDATQVIHACLRGAREGLLVLLWDILCPSCQIPANVAESLEALESHGHCEACNVDFELDFSNSIEMIFRAHPEIRDVDVRTYCIGGPSFSAHVVAQSRIAAGERFEFEIDLPEGAYRLRGPQLPYSVDLRVARAGTIGRWEVPLSKPPPREIIPTLKVGSQVITLLNDGPTELLVRLERIASRHDAVTAAEASSLPMFRTLLPDQNLSAGRMVSVATVTLLSVQLDRAAELYAELGDGEAFSVVRRALIAVEETISEHGGAIVKYVAEGVVATFNDRFKAASAACDLSQVGHVEEGGRALGIKISLHCGPAMVTMLNDRLDYFGSTVHRTSRLLDMALPGEIMTTDAITSHPEFSRLMRERGWHVDVVPDSHVSALDGSIVQRCSAR